MRVFIVHHHLHTGGVTKVIQTQIQALKAQGIDVECMVGVQPDSSLDAKLHILNELNYLDPDLKPDDWNKQYEVIKSFFLSKLNDDKKSDVIHVHNLNLGKNPIVTLVLHDLANDGYSVLNHCHDFAEDDRPDNMNRLKDVIEVHFNRKLEDIMYPNLKHYSFATINQKDHQRLLNKPYPENKVLNLPNAIAKPTFKQDGNQQHRVREALQINDDKPLIVYPVRAIRRKNIGEFILLAYLFAEEAHWLITQPPKNPIELEAYLKWVKFCETNHIDVCFEAGNKVDFDDLMSSVDRMISTSTTEGFGLSFIEPWLYGKAVVGRDIPEITQDFKQLEIDLNHLYSSLLVKEGTDFAKLPEEDKQAFISSLQSNPTLTEQWRKRDEFRFLLKPFADNEISHNAKQIEEHFSPNAYGQKLHKFYESAF